MVANSQTDFSGTQGSGGWYYGYYNASQNVGRAYAASNFVEVTRIGRGFDGLTPALGGDWIGGRPRDDNGPAGFWTALSADGGHPNGANTMYDV